MSGFALRRETSALHHVMMDPEKRIRFTKHSLEEMKDDKIIEAHVRAVLSDGKVTWIETKRDQLWHVEGRDVDERSIRLVVVVDEAEKRIKVVTAMVLQPSKLR